MSSEAFNNTEASIDLWELKFTPGFLGFLLVAYVIVFAMSLIGNIVVIATVCRIPSMHTTINYFICNLSTADMLMAILCLPLNFLSNAFKNWVAGRALCKAVPYLQGVAVAASVTTLSIIAFDRYMAVCHPLRRHFSKKQSMLLIAGVWVYVLTLLSPWFITFDLHPKKFGNATLLVCKTSMTKEQYVAYQLGVIFCLLYVVPLFFIVVCYTLVARKLNGRSQNTEEFLRKSSTAQDRKKMSRLVKMLVTVVLIFALSWLPLHSVMMLDLIDLASYLIKQGQITLPIIQWVAISNCCVNPWIYCAFSRNYRINFVNTLLCRFPSGQSRRHACAHNQLVSTRSFGQYAANATQEQQQQQRQQQQQQQQPMELAEQAEHA